ncbi:MAG: hypothetical protein ACK4K5_07725 [Thermosynechococcus sp.]|uniref:hypothetical protein n=1 Tax=Thermosynechococcus sp. TaxID=2814275 RepID=UPI00391DD26A
MARVVVLGAGIGGLPTAYELRQRLGDRHQVVLVSDVERFTFIEKRGIETITNAAITAIEQNCILLQDGQRIPFGYSMMLPPFCGAAFVRVSGLGNEKGFLPLLPTLQHPDDPEIYGVGISIHLPSLEVTPFSSVCCWCSYDSRVRRPPWPVWIPMNWGKP